MEIETKAKEKEGKTSILCVYLLMEAGDRGCRDGSGTLCVCTLFSNTNTNTNTNNLFPPIPCDTIMFIYDNYDNIYDNTISCSCLLFIKNLITMSLWNRISGSHFRSLVEVGSSHSALGRKK